MELTARHLVDANRKALQEGILLAQQPDKEGTSKFANQTLRRPTNIYVDDRKPGCGCAIGVALTPAQRKEVLKRSHINFFEYESLFMELGIIIKQHEKKIVDWTVALHDMWNDREIHHGPDHHTRHLYNHLPDPLVKYLVSQEEKKVDEKAFVGWLDAVDKYISETAQ